MQGWHIINDSDTVIIFVHGIFSDSKKCWTSNNGKFWPDLILEDNRIPSPSIFLASFYTTPTSNDYGIKDCSIEIYKSLLRKDQDNNLPPIHNKNLIFVTHSTGGIITRYLLEANRDSFVGKRIGLCLYASPSFGSKLSTFLGGIAKFFNNKLAQELNWGSHILKDLDDRFINLLHSEKLEIFGMEAIENKAPFKIPFTGKRVVEELSAARYFGNKRLIPNSDHSSIVKPDCLNNPSHQYFYDFLIDNKIIDHAPLIQNKQCLSLFDRYKPEVEHYFIRRTADKEIKKTLHHYSIWIWGESGLGKTVSITRAIYLYGYNIKYISLGSSIGDSILDLIREIYIELSQTKADEVNGSYVSNYIKPIVEIISSNCKSKNYCLFIEEIPLEDKNKFIEFSNYIYSILKSIENTANFKLVLSSIYCPNINLVSEMEKISERLKIIEWGLWSDPDIEKLVSVISKDIDIQLDNDYLIENFDNNPRKVKNYFRDKLASKTHSDNS